MRRFKVGDAVYARPRDGHIGAFAERIAVKEPSSARAGQSMGRRYRCRWPTVWQILVERAQLQRGQAILIHAGFGGMGTRAILLARRLGATVATPTSAANADLVRSLGADEVIDYKTQDFATLLSDYEVVLNSLDGKMLPSRSRCSGAAARSSRSPVRPSPPSPRRGG